MDNNNTDNQAMRFNSGKLRWSLVHFASLVPMVRVLEFGADKYSPDNWKKPMDRKAILESMQRHLAALFDGEENDSESGLSHMGHIMCNAMFYCFHNVIVKTTNNITSTSLREEVLGENHMPIERFIQLGLKFKVDENGIFIAFSDGTKFSETEYLRRKVKTETGMDIDSQEYRDYLLKTK